MDRPKTFFQSLFDLSFETFITGGIVRVLYVLSIAGAGLWALFLIVGGFQNSAGMGILMLLIGGPLAFLVSVIYARVILEIILVIFRISEHTAKMAGAVPPGAASGPRPAEPEPHPGASPETGDPGY